MSNYESDVPSGSRPIIQDSLLTIQTQSNAIDQLFVQLAHIDRVCRFLLHNRCAAI